MKEKVKEAMDKVRPMLQRDGGDVELVDVDEASGVVKVKLTGLAPMLTVQSMLLTPAGTLPVQTLVPS